ncbi:DUF4115 domain-containing protein [Ruficoccus amylovorans]|uniref:DUF4115 domain-containing protein n=1 Tax=Ruficoccus amylovorans TaxID=1804625 RepID=A0A842HML9_9BACT|nr:RodZ domain-containing protein [Ruficoccus amylovorans]MBC2596331.1 DUF4115 domain-containing protein [Ruficoccus amylovorans]
MPNIGDRLEEARKRQGISIREAAEATKVRSDFLMNFENNHFDFDLPEVYKRGFLKIYGRYLKLDEDKLMTDYNAVLLGASKVVSKRENKELFGRMDLPDEPKTLGSTESAPPFGEHSAKVAKTARIKERPSSGHDGPADRMEQKTDSSLYWKIGLIVAGTFVLVGLLAVLVNLLISPSAPDEPTDTATTPPAASTNVTPSGTAAGADLAQTGTVTISTSGPAYVLVRQENDNKELFKGNMAAGQSETLTRTGTVRVVSSAIQNVTVEINGKTYKSNQTGTRQTYYGMDGPVTPLQNP